MCITTARRGFYVLEGEYIMYLDDREFVCPAGSFIFIPQGARHGFRVTGELRLAKGPAVWFLWREPAGAR